MNLRQSSLTRGAMLEGVRGRCHPLAPRTTSAQVYWVRPGQLVRLWMESDEHEDNDERFVAVSYVGPDPIPETENVPVQVVEASWIIPQRGAIHVTLKNAAFRLRPGCIVFERFTLDPASPELVHMKLLVCSKRNHLGLPELKRA